MHDFIDWWDKCKPGEGNFAATMVPSRSEVSRCGPTAKSVAYCLLALIAHLHEKQASGDVDARPFQAIEGTHCSDIPSFKSFFCTLWSY
jgi:hypothetical protein